MSRTILATVVVLSLTCVAAAQPYLSPGTVPVAPAGNPSRAQIFNWLDVNHDGFLTLQEYLAAPWIKNKAQARKFFSWMDRDKDGRVSLAEFLAAYDSYNGPSGYSIRVAYPGAWVWWRPWRYGWSWHAAGWRPGWNGGWYHVAHKGRGVVVHAHAHHPIKHHAKHPKPHKAKPHKSHKAKPHGHKKGHGHSHTGHSHHGHGHK